MRADLSLNVSTGVSVNTAVVRDWGDSSRVAANISNALGMGTSVDEIEIARDSLSTDMTVAEMLIKCGCDQWC